MPRPIMDPFPPTTRRAVLAAIPASLLAASVLAAPASQPATPSTRPGNPSTEEKIRALAAYYAKVYGDPLSSPERLPKQIAILSLSRIDAPETTAKLLDIFSQRDRDPVVWYLAWEALHARVASLNREQRRRWATGGLQASLVSGGFPGTTVAPLLLAMAEHNMVAFEDQPYRLAARVVRENGLEKPEQKQTLDALARLVTVWHDPSLVRALLSVANKPELAPRVDYVLRKLPDPPAEVAAPRIQATWATWLEKAKLKPAGQDALPDYKPEGTRVFSAPATITDPNDKRWYAELEIGKLTVTDIDLVWAIDSTGSMNDENQLVAAQTGLVARLCSLVSRRARCGAIYARHEIEQGYLKPCCQEAGSKQGWYQVKPHALTTDVKLLATAMAAERIPKPDKANEGNVHPGTPVLGALQGAITKMKWSSDKHARKVIVLVGDSPLTPGTEKPAEVFAAQAQKDGFQIHALATRRANVEWQPVLKAAGGTILPFSTRNVGGAPPPARKPRRLPINSPAAESPLSVFGQLAVQVIRDSVSPAYRNRIDPLVGILMKYAEAAHAVETPNPG